MDMTPSGPLLLLLVSAVGLVPAAHTPTPTSTPTPTNHHPSLLNESSVVTSRESHWLAHTMAAQASVVTTATGKSSSSYRLDSGPATRPSPARRSKRDAEPLQLTGERRGRKPKRRKKRRRQKKRKRKRTRPLRGGTSRGGKQQHHHHGIRTPASSHTPALITPWKHHKTRLVELLTGGNDQFLVRDPKAFNPSQQLGWGVRGGSDGAIRLPRRNARQFMLPLEIVNSESLMWVPYNPNIRVSIQVIGEGGGDDGEADDNPPRPFGSDDHGSKQRHHQQKHNEAIGVFPGDMESKVYSSRTLGIPSVGFEESNAGNTPSPHPPPNIITSNAKDEQNQATKGKPRPLDGKRQRTGDKRGRGKQRRKLEREKDGGQKGGEKSRGYEEWGGRDATDSARGEGKSENGRREEKAGDKERKRGQARKGEERQSGWPQDLVQGLAEDLERMLSRDKQEAGDPAVSDDAGGDPCVSWSSCRVESALQELANLPSLPACPCLYPADLPYRHNLYDSIHRRSFRWVGVSGERERIDVYHRGAHSCIRSHVTTTSLAAQTCCYDRERKLLTRGSGAGSPALVSPQVNSALHWQVDILPWLACRGNFLRYQAVRPPNNGQKCPTNPDNLKYQQQVYMATDY